MPLNVLTDDDRLLIRRVGSNAVDVASRHAILLLYLLSDKQ